MSENSPPTPVNATIDLEQLQSLIAAQAQVNSTQECQCISVCVCVKYFILYVYTIFNQRSSTTYSHVSIC